MVEEEHAQSERMRGLAPPPEDHWQPYAGHFKAEPRRTDDPLVSRLLQEVAPHHAVLDVGAGAGRLALPLAFRCRHVVAIEPSPSMASALLQQAQEYGIHNVSVVQAKWEEAEVEPADLVLCAHVVYTVQDIEAFVRKLEDHARERVLIVLFKTPPQSQVYPLWRKIHGEDRLPLPSLPQLEPVLKELGVAYRTEMLPSQPARGFDSAQQALEQLGRRLFVGGDDPKRGQLEGMIGDLLEEQNGVFRLKGAPALEAALVSWQPGDG